jgi:hypothetical protein
VGMVVSPAPVQAPVPVEPIMVGETESREQSSPHL